MQKHSKLPPLFLHSILTVMILLGGCEGVEEETSIKLCRLFGVAFCFVIAQFQLSLSAVQYIRTTSQQTAARCRPRLRVG